jgi:hypothetical protein
VSITGPQLSKTSGKIYVIQGSDITLLSTYNQVMQYVVSNNPNLAKTICFTLISSFLDYTVTFNALNLFKDIYVADNADSSKYVFQSLFNGKSKKRYTRWQPAVQIILYRQRKCSF